MHGGIDDMTVENNHLIQPSGSRPGCFGIEISGGYADSRGGEYFRNVTIRGNQVVNVGYVGIGLRNCSNCIVEDNGIIWTGAGGSAGHLHERECTERRGRTRNGTDHPPQLDLSRQGLQRRSTGVRLLNEGAGHAVSSNIVYFGRAPPLRRCVSIPPT